MLVRDGWIQKKIRVGISVLLQLVLVAALAPRAAFADGTWTLAYSKTQSAVGAGSLVITATCNLLEPPNGATGINIDRPGGGNDVINGALTSSGTNVRVFSYTVQPQNGGTILDGLTTVTLDPPSNAAVNNTFTIDTLQPTATITYDKSPAAYRNGDSLTLTITFSEAITPTTPSITITGGSVAGFPVNGDALVTPSPDRKTWNYFSTAQIGNGGGDPDGVRTITFGGTDLAGNPIATPPTNDTFRIDNLAPTATLTFSRSPSAVNAGSLTITADFVESLSSAVTPTLTFGGAAAGAGNFSSVSPAATRISPSQFTYTVDVTGTTPQTGNSFVATLSAGQDLAGNVQTDTTQSGTIDVTAPTATLSFSRSSTGLNAGPLTITANFIESMSSDVTPTLTFSGAAATAGNFSAVTPTATRISATQYVYAVTVQGSTPSSGNLYSATLSGAQDLAGNAQTNASANGLVDTEPPTATLTYSKSSRAYKNGDTLTVTATFSETIFPAAATITITGATGPTGTVAGQTVTNATMTSPFEVRRIWVFTAAGPLNDPDGVRTVTFGASDFSGNALVVQPTDNTFTIDNTPPTATLTYSKSSKAYHAGELLLITATFLEDITPTPTRITLSGGTIGGGDIAGNAMTNASGDRRTWLFAESIAGASDAEGPRTITLGATDLAGNALTAQPSGNTLTIDLTPPTATLAYSKSGKSYRNGDSIAITATFAENITPTAASITITGGKVTGSTVTASPMTNPSGDLKTWLFSVDGPINDPEGVRTVNLGATDLAGNALAAQPAGNTFTIDNTPPTATLTYNKSSQVYRNGNALTLTATFLEDITPTAPAITITGGKVGGSAVAAFPMFNPSGDKRVWTFTADGPVNDPEGVRTVTLGATDLAGNALAAQPTGNAFTIDNTPPTATLSYSKSSRVYKNADALTITATFSEVVTPTAATITITGGTVGNATPTATAMTNPSADLRTWLFSATVATASDVDGPRTLTLGATDLAGNALTAQPSGNTFAIDGTAPTATLSYSKTPHTYGVGEALTITATFLEDITPTAVAITLTGGKVGNSTVTNTAMTNASSDNRTWLFNATIASGDGSGDRAVTLSAADLAGNALTAQPTDNTFTITNLLPTVALTYSKTPALYRSAETLVLTATFDKDITPSNPTIAIAGGTLGGASYATPVAMTPSGEGRRLFTLTQNLSLGASPDGIRTATVSGADVAGNANTSTANDTFQLDSAPPVGSLTFSRGPGLMRAGPLTVTADFSEPLTDTPTLTFSGAAAANFSAAAPTAAGISSTRFVYAVTVQGQTAVAGSAFTVTLAAGLDAAGNVQADVARSGVVDTTPPPAPNLTFSPGPARLSAGPLTVTATYAESIGTTPTLTFSSDAGGRHFALGSTSRAATDTFVFAVTIDSTTTVGAGDSYSATVAGGVDVAGNPQAVAATFNGVVDNGGTPAVNLPPIAAIAFTPPASGQPRQLELDGTGSRDPENATLTYSWLLADKPGGAAAFTASTAKVVYLAIQPGSYRFVLTVFDDKLQTSTAEQSFTVLPAEPHADAGLAREVTLTRAGAPIGTQTTLVLQLDGTGTYELSSSALVYSWTVVEAPDLAAGKTPPTTLVAFDDPASAAPRVVFNPAVLGTGAGARLAAAGYYRFRLTGTSGGGQSSSDVTVLAVDPVALNPVADAGLDRDEVFEGFYADPTVVPPDDAAGTPLNRRDFLRLNGRESSDPLERPLAYRWDLVAKPGASTLTLAGLSGADGRFPSFRPDVPGLFSFLLTVNNGLLASAPGVVQLRLTDPASLPPVAIVTASVDFAERVVRGIRTVVVFARPGESVTLDGRRSFDPDDTGAGPITFRWTQGADSHPVAFAVAAPTLTFTPERTGFDYDFTLTVTDGRGDTDSVRALVIAQPVALPANRLSVVASATGTSQNGLGLDSDVTVGSFRALRVVTPATVTLTAQLDGPFQSGQTAAPSSPLVVDPHVFLWRQIEGPTVALSNVGGQTTLSLESTTTFTPTTSRLHVFEVIAGRSVNGRIFKERRQIVRITVDTPAHSVPERNVAFEPATIASTGDESGRTVRLDATASQVARLAAGAVVTYQWRQVGGPRGRFANPYAAKTTFVAPSIVSSSPIRYLIELTVDATRPGDRSESQVVAITQQPILAGPPVSNVGSISGGGCSLSGDPAGGIAWLDLAPLAFLLVWGRRRRSSPFGRRPLDSLF